MESIKEALVPVMRDLESQKNGLAPKNTPQDWLKKTLTKKEMGHIRFKYFKKGTLSLSVDSSSWLYALTLKKQELLEGLQKQNIGVRDILLRIGDV